MFLSHHSHSILSTNLICWCVCYHFVWSHLFGPHEGMSSSTGALYLIKLFYNLSRKRSPMKVLCLAMPLSSTASSIWATNQINSHIRKFECNLVRLKPCPCRLICKTYEKDATRSKASAVLLRRWWGERTIFWSREDGRPHRLGLQ